MADRIEIYLDVEGIGVKRINVRRNLYVRNLIDEVRSKFDFRQGGYVLRWQESDLALDPDRTLEHHQVEDGAALSFSSEAQQQSEAQRMIEAGTRASINTRQQVYLEEEREGRVFDIAWQPAIMGRADQTHANRNKLLAVDLTSTRGSEFVSRHHACITEANGQYYVEGLSARNPTYVNNMPLAMGERTILQPGDRIRVGRISLIFHLRG
jgi:pSer/pThr/pTyr-binding forkhead associated (FHA) protein